MAGVRGKSGPPGNLNGARHPWRTFWRRRALRPADRWIVPVIQEYEASISADKAEDLTAGERRMVEIATVARGCAMLILAQARDAGFIRETEEGWDLHPGAKELPKFLGIERGALQAIGLERRARSVSSTATIDYMSGKVEGL